MDPVKENVEYRTRCTRGQDNRHNELINWTLPTFKARKQMGPGLLVWKEICKKWKSVKTSRNVALLRRNLKHTFRVSKKSLKLRKGKTEERKEEHQI